jgi:hypothetical protein
MASLKCILSIAEQCDLTSKLYGSLSNEGLPDLHQIVNFNKFIEIIWLVKGSAATHWVEVTWNCLRVWMVIFLSFYVLRATACKKRESQVKWKYSNFFLFHQINPFSVPTMEKILKSCCDFFCVRFLHNPDFAGNELIFMLEPADI